MNEVYLRGKLVSVYEPIAPAGQPSIWCTSCGCPTRLRSSR